MTDGTAGLIESAPIGLRRLALTDFRGYGSLRLSLDTRPVVLTGANGAGKTNLLEAVSMLAPGRGLRRAKLSDIARDGVAGQAWGVAATIDTADGPVDIGTGRAAGESDRRLLRIDGRPARSQGDLGNVLTILWLTPAMDRLFTEGTSGRRRFFDRLAYGLAPDHAGHLSAYENAYRQRAKLLRDGGAVRGWLEGLEEIMVTNGVAIADIRNRTLARLRDALDTPDGPFPRATIALEGVVEGWLAEMTPEDAQHRFRAALADARSRERAGAPTDGPQRSDFVVTHADTQQPANRCSTGEQKALLIALLLAQARVQTAERGMAPVILFDEIAAHLDQSRREALFDRLIHLGAQCWLTGTDEPLFAPLRGHAQFLTIKAASATLTDGPPASML